MSNREKGRTMKLKVKTPNKKTGYVDGYISYGERMWAIVVIGSKVETHPASELEVIGYADMKTGVVYSTL